MTDAAAAALAATEAHAIRAHGLGIRFRRTLPRNTRRPTASRASDMSAEMTTLNQSSSSGKNPAR